MEKGVSQAPLPSQTAGARLEAGGVAAVSRALRLWGWESACLQPTPGTSEESCEGLFEIRVVNACAVL